MSRVCGRILVVLLPIFIVLMAFSYVTFEGGTPRIPTFDQLYAFFSSAPDGVALVRDFTRTWSDGWDKVVATFSGVASAEDFWVAVTGFFNWMGSVIVLVGKFLFFPLQYVVWFFVKQVRFFA